MFWHPGATESKRQCLPASHPELMARFVKESSLARAELLPDIDHMDLEARHETLHMKGEPVMVQICVVPCYAMTIHKTQLGFDPVLLFIYSGCLVGPPVRKGR